jgi:hypothetical protein
MEIKKSFFKGVFITGVGLCALCCALPFIGIALCVGSLSVTSFYLDKLGWALMLISLAFLLYRYFKKGKSNTCSTNCTCSDTNQP